MKVLVTGGAGFIGSHFVRFLLKKCSGYEVVCLDKLTYAGNKENLSDVADDPRFSFIQGDIGDVNLLSSICADALVNFAAHTHVDRSLQKGAWDFIDTNVRGAVILAEYVRDKGIQKYIHISTDEVYGSIKEGYATESSMIAPTNLYAASKAGADMAVMSFYKTFGLPLCIVRSTNNYGPYQYPEKVIPLFITNALEDKSLPLYGDGSNRRHWIYVEDNVRAIECVLREGKKGEIYNIGTDNEISNLELARMILASLHKPQSLIQSVNDRPGHDWRYALDSTKIKALGFKPEYVFEKGLAQTIEWYRQNIQWWKKIKDRQKEYQEFYRAHYTNRAGQGPHQKSNKELP